MSDPRDEVPPREAPPATPQDAVQAMHTPHMAVMHDRALVGTDPLPGESAASHPLTRDVLMHEHAEPKDGFEPAPFLMYVLFGGLLLWGGFYFGTRSGPMTDTISVLGVEIPWFAARAFDRNDLWPENSQVAAPDPDPQTLEDYKLIGAQVYATICQACHQPTGLGNPAQGVPPLAGSEWVTGAEASPDRLARIVLYGLGGPITVAGKPYSGLMPAQGSSLKDYQIAGVLTYIRNSFGHAADAKEPSITTATVKAVRAKDAGRSTTGTAAMTEAQLKAIPLTPTDAP